MDLIEHPLLELINLNAGYGKSHVLHNLSLKVYKSEIVTVVGANGAGKTTILRSIFGFTTISGGKVLFKGGDITKRDAHKLVKIGLAYVPQDDSVFPSLTVQENLDMGGFILSSGAFKKNKELVMDLFPRIRERLNQRARTLSGGERRMLAIARGLMTDPEMMVLDEPSLGLAPQIQSIVFEQIKKINSKGVTVLLVEQNAQQALEVANRGYVLDFGEIRKEGTGLELINDEEIQKAYLGE